MNNETIKISELQSASSITATDVLPIVQNGETKKANILNTIYPIGSIYISILSTYPGTLFGGTWQQFGQGRTLVGLNTQDEDFDTLLKAGGSKYLQQHTHNFNINASFGTTSSTGGYMGGTAGEMSNIVGNVDNVTTGDSGNLQPYIVVSMWVRVS